jgi:hypothetical protein
MAESQYDKYLVIEPIRGKGMPSFTYMNNDLVPGCNIDIMFNWIMKMPDRFPPSAKGHSHDYDEVIFNLGVDPNNPEDLGGEIEGFMGDAKQIISRTSALFIPRNIVHGVTGWTRFERPHIQMAIKLSGGKL